MKFRTWIIADGIDTSKYVFNKEGLKNLLSEKELVKFMDFEIAGWDSYNYACYARISERVAYSRILDFIRSLCMNTKFMAKYLYNEDEPVLDWKQVHICGGIHILNRSGIFTCKDIISKSVDDLCAVRTIGRMKAKKLHDYASELLKQANDEKMEKLLGLSVFSNEDREILTKLGFKSILDFTKYTEDELASMEGITESLMTIIIFHLILNGLYFAREVTGRVITNIDGTFTMKVVNDEAGTTEQQLRFKEYLRESGIMSE